jgi:hypothetical protein
MFLSILRSRSTRAVQAQSGRFFPWRLIAFNRAGLHHRPCHYDDRVYDSGKGTPASHYARIAPGAAWRLAAGFNNAVTNGESALAHRKSRRGRAAPARRWAFAIRCNRTAKRQLLNWPRTVCGLPGIVCTLRVLPTYPSVDMSMSSSPRSRIAWLMAFSAESFQTVHCVSLCPCVASSLFFPHLGCLNKQYYIPVATKEATSRLTGREHLGHYRDYRATTASDGYALEAERDPATTSQTHW